MKKIAHNSIVFRLFRSFFSIFATGREDNGTRCEIPKQALVLFRSFLLIFVLLSCDDGRIYDTEAILPEEGRVVKLTGEVTGSNWTDKYSVVLAGFAEESGLYQTLASDVSTSWGYDHTKEVLSPAWLELLKDWIDAGANE